MRLWVWIVLALIVAALAAGYSAYWKIVHDRAVIILDQQVAAWRAEGYDVDWESRETGGFPLKVEAVFAAPRASSPGGASPWSWSGETLRVHLRPWSFQRITLTPEGLSTATTPELGTLDAFSRDFAVTLEADAQGVKLVEIRGFGAGAVARPSGETIVGAEEIELRAARDRDDPGLYRVTGQARGPEWRNADRGAPQSLTLDMTLERADILAAYGELAPAALAAWADAGGRLTVNDLSADWGDSTIAARGDLTLDRSGGWNGEIALESREPARAFLHLAELGAIEPDTAAQAGAIAGALAENEGSTARLSFNVRGGDVRLLGMRLGRVQPAY
jgi:hypothetical protein